MSGAELTRILVQLAALLALAKFFGGLVRRAGYPSVCGEIIAGIALAAGLELRISSLRANARVAAAVSLGGIVVPFGLGFGSALWFPQRLDMRM